MSGHSATALQLKFGKMAGDTRSPSPSSSPDLGKMAGKTLSPSPSSSPDPNPKTPVANLWVVTPFVR